MKLRLLSIIALLAVCGAARAEERLYVLKQALVDPSAPISRGVREECGLDGHVSDMLLKAARRVSPDATGVAATSEVPAGEKVVVATILAVHGIQGGGWTGAKSITVRADLMQNGQVVGSRVITRRVGKTFRGIAGDTCGLFAGLIPQLGDDVRFWLAGVATASAERTAATGSAQVEPALLVQVPAEIAEDSRMRESFRSECGLPSLVGNQVLKEVSARFPDVGTTDRPGPDTKGRVLRLSILDLKAESENLRTVRGVFLRVEVMEGTNVLGTQVLEGSASARRGSKESSCSILQNACARLGQQVALWLGQQGLVPQSGAPASSAAAARGTPTSGGAVSLDDLPLQQGK